MTTTDTGVVADRAEQDGHEHAPMLARCHPGCPKYDPREAVPGEQWRQVSPVRAALRTHAAREMRAALGYQARADDLAAQMRQLDEQRIRALQHRDTAIGVLRELRISVREARESLADEWDADDRGDSEVALLLAGTMLPGEKADYK